MQVLLVCLYWFRYNLLEKCVLQPEIAKKVNKTPILAFKVIQDYWFRCQSKASLWLPISALFLRYGYLSAKNCDFFLPLLFSATARGDLFGIYGKALRFLKLESSRQPKVIIWWFWLAPFLTDPPMWQTDGRTELRWLRRTAAVAAVALKIHYSVN